MSPATPQQLVDNYLKRLRSASRELPREERGELRAQIEEHLRDALPTPPTDAATRTVLERLGDPQDLVAEHLDRLGMPARRVGSSEWTAIILLLIGGFIFLVGWIAGVVLLWGSRAWTTREKLIGTLVVPGGLVAPLLFGLVGLSGGPNCVTSGGPGRPTITRCTGGTSAIHDVLVWAALVVLLLAPVAASVFLARRARTVAT
jgi:hypothetical protein